MTGTKQYTVQSPDGKTHVIEGPDGASDEEVIQQAKNLFGGGDTPDVSVKLDYTTPQQSQDQAWANRNHPSAAITQELQPQPTTWMDAIRGTSDDLQRGLAEATTGAVKGAAGTLQNVANAVSLKGHPSFVSAALSGVNTQPSNPWQTGGKLAENAAEFFLPSGPIAEGMKGVEAVTAASKLPTLAKGALNLGARAGMEAAGAGAVTAAQTGDSGQAATNAAIAGAVPLAGAVVNPFKEFLATKLSGRMMNNLIKPLGKEFSFGKNPGQRVASEGITANSMDELAAKITRVKDETGTAIGQAIDSVPPTTVQDVEPLIKEPLRIAKLKAIKSGDKELFNRLTDIENGLTQDFAEQNGKLAATGNKNLAMPVKDIQALKQQVGGDMTWTGQAFDDQVNKVRSQIYHNLDMVVDKNVPGIDKLNSKYADLLSAEKAVERRKQIIQRLAMLPLTETMVGLAAGIASQAHGNDLTTSGINALVFSLATKGARSTTAQTRIASELAKLSPGERSVIVQAVPLIRNLGFAAESANASQDQ